MIHSLRACYKWQNLRFIARRCLVASIWTALWGFNGFALSWTGKSMQWTKSSWLTHLIFSSIETHLRLCFFENTVVVIGDGCRRRETKVTSRWLDVCHGPNGERVKNNEMIRAGTIFGPPDPIIWFAGLLLEKWPKPHCLWETSIVNYMLCTEEYTEARLKVKRSSCLGPVLTLASCTQKVTLGGGVKNGFNQQDEIPYVGHQWKNHRPFSRYIGRVV
jgi:hypothetical protein